MNLFGVPEWSAILEQKLEEDDAFGAHTRQKQSFERDQRVRKVVQAHKQAHEHLFIQQITWQRYE